MNCMNKKVLARKQEIAYEQKQEAEKQLLNSMSLEERKTYKDMQEERRKLAMKAVTTAMSFSAFINGPYGS